MIKFFHEGQGSAMTADGTNAGVITVADTTGFYPGATAWLSDNSGTNNTRIIIKAVLSATTMQARRIAPGDYTLADVSAFLLANSARIDQEPQVVSDELGRGNTSASSNINNVSGVPAASGYYT